MEPLCKVASDKLPSVAPRCANLTYFGFVGYYLRHEGTIIEGEDHSTIVLGGRHITCCVRLVPYGGK